MNRFDFAAPLRPPPQPRARAARRGAGRGGAEDVPRLAGPKLAAAAEPEFDEKPQCLKRFTAMTFQPVFARVNPRVVGFEAPFAVMAEFTGPCKCGDLEYRQFIRGRITRDPGGPDEADYGHLLDKLPEGRLNQSFQEDGDTSDPVVNYGHRGNPGVDRPKLKDQYTNARGDIDQANGCRYEMSDTPWATMNSAAGVAWDIRLDFYGEIRNRGRAIQRRCWTPINGRFTAP